MNTINVRIRDARLSRGQIISLVKPFAKVEALPRSRSTVDLPPLVSECSFVSSTNASAFSLTHWILIQDSVLRTKQTAMLSRENASCFAVSLTDPLRRFDIERFSIYCS